MFCLIMHNANQKGQIFISRSDFAFFRNTTTKKSARCLEELFPQALRPRTCSRDILAD